jgi:hypothetical protein
MKLTTNDLLDHLNSTEWDLVQAKLRSAQLALRITAGAAYEDSDWDAQQRAECTMDDLAELAAAI